MKCVSDGRLAKSHPVDGICAVSNIDEHNVLVSQEPSSELPIEGRFPGWAAVVGMVIFPLIGVFVVGLTTWKASTKVVVGIVGTVLWVIAAVMMIRAHLGGAT